MVQKFSTPNSLHPVSEIIDGKTIERLRDAGFVLVPLRPTDEMKTAGAPCCFIVPDGTFETAINDADECYCAMVKLGCL
jgi:hypothetical protein